MIILDVLVCDRVLAASLPIASECGQKGGLNFSWLVPYHYLDPYEEEKRQNFYITHKLSRNRKLHI